jgi:small-conductance mechanosensitive channel
MSDLVPRSLVLLFSIGLTILLIFGCVRLLRYLFRDTEFARSLSMPGVVRFVRAPFRTVVAIAGINIVLFSLDSREDWVVYAQHAIKVALIVSIVWLLCAVAFAIESILIDRYEADAHPEEVRVRRSITQISLLRRMAVVAVVFLGAAAILATFSAFRAVGAGLLASAGLISIVVGIAAQTTLSNVFAGIHLAFSNMLRVDDVIVIDGESGTIDDITLTTVVVHLWNDRRLILPCSHFIEHGFENWTRSGQPISGEVHLDLDWTAPFDDLRAELNRVLAESPLWDGRTGSMAVCDAVGGNISVRFDVSAADTLKLFGLRNAVREAMITYLVKNAPHSFPKTRTELIRE